MRKLETSAKTVEEAIEQGLKELGVGIGDVDVQVLEEGSKGLFGLFGSRLAKVSLTVKEEEENLLEGLIDDDKQPAVKTGKPLQSPKAPRKEKQAANGKTEIPEEKKSEPEKKEEYRPEPEIGRASCRERV